MAAPGALVLLSGGLDSASLIAVYARAKWNVRALHVAFGQRAHREEALAAATVAGHYQVPLEIITIAGLQAWPASQALPGRNAMLVMLALAHAGTTVDVIALGIHAGSRYWDCSQQFADELQTIIDGYALGIVRLGTPFLSWSKREIARFASDSGLPIAQTYSCDSAEGPCGGCGSCRDRHDALS